MEPRKSDNVPVDLILSLSKDEVVARSSRPTSWFDELTMRSLERLKAYRWSGGGTSVLVLHSISQTS